MNQYENDHNVCKRCMCVPSQEAAADPSYRDSFKPQQSKDDKKSRRKQILAAIGMHRDACSPTYTAGCTARSDILPTLKQGIEHLVSSIAIDCH